MFHVATRSHLISSEHLSVRDGGRCRHCLPVYNGLFSICPQERLLTLKRSMSFMQDMDFSQQAAILGDEDIAAEEPQPAVISTPVESAKKSKKQPHHREPLIR